MKNYSITRSADVFFLDGCGRCALVGTNNCKARIWQHELALLRDIVLESELKEEAKWGMPCYTLNGSNVLIIYAFKEHCGLAFFKGVFINDPDNILVSAGENVQGGKQLRFTNTQDIEAKRARIKQFIEEAIAIEKAGLKLKYKQLDEYEVPEELLEVFDENPALKKAFESLTPGRQKGYLMHFAQAKQSKTRRERIHKNEARIMEGKGLNDR